MKFIRLHFVHHLCSQRRKNAQLQFNIYDLM